MEGLDPLLLEPALVEHFTPAIAGGDRRGCRLRRGAVRGQARQTCSPTSTEDSFVSIPTTVATASQSRDTRRDQLPRRAQARHGLGHAHRPRVFIIGQGVSDHKGTFGSTLGFVDEFGARARHRHAARGGRDHRHCHRCGAERALSDQYAHPRGLRAAGDEPDRQSGSEVPATCSAAGSRCRC